MLVEQFYNKEKEFYMTNIQLPHSVIKQNTQFDFELHATEITIIKAQIVKEELVGKIRRWLEDIQEEYGFVIGRDEVDMKTGEVILKETSLGESISNKG